MSIENNNKVEVETLRYMINDIRNKIDKFESKIDKIGSDIISEIEKNKNNSQQIENIYSFLQDIENRCPFRNLVTDNKKKMEELDKKMWSTYFTLIAVIVSLAFNVISFFNK